MNETKTTAAEPEQLRTEQPGQDPEEFGAAYLEEFLCEFSKLTTENQLMILKLLSILTL